MGGSHSVWCVCRILTSSAVSHADQFLGLVTVMFAGTGTLLNTSKRLQNQGKVCILPLFNLRAIQLCLVQPVRYNVDAWDDMMMDRDKRLTGHKRGQQVCLSSMFSMV